MSEGGCRGSRARELPRTRTKKGEKTAVIPHQWIKRCLELRVHKKGVLASFFCVLDSLWLDKRNWSCLLSFSFHFAFADKFIHFDMDSPNTMSPSYYAALNASDDSNLQLLLYVKCCVRWGCRFLYKGSMLVDGVTDDVEKYLGSENINFVYPEERVP